MSDDWGRAFVALTVAGLWFSCQAVVFWILWNFSVVRYFGLDDLTLIDGFVIFFVLRLLFHPPKLSVELD